MSDTFSKLAAHFPVGDVRKRPGRGGIELSWVEARVVTDRLNQVLGADGWSFRCEIVSQGSPAVVKGKLEIHRADGISSVREDFGYSTGGSGEDLKEAVSDAIRRVASLAGVSSYLYAHSQGVEGGKPAPAWTPAPAPVAAQPAAAQPAVGHDTVVLRAAQLFADGECPDHRQPWTRKPGGVSKATGREYQPFWACSGKSGDQWCKRKPSMDWIKSQDAPVGEPQRNEDDLESLPF